MVGSADVRTRWERLLVWLQDHGMKTDQEDLFVECKARPGAGNGLFTTKPCPPSTRLFLIPPSAQINILTLSPHYPSHRPQGLSATQLVSLHIGLHRPKAPDGRSSDPRFGPYLDVLPREFDEHPLTWVTLKPDAEPERGLLSCLPPAVRITLNQVASKFEKDWDTVRDYLREHPEIVRKSGRQNTPDLTDGTPGHRTTKQDFLWGWLNVNSRCVYHHLKPTRSDPDNLLMCPILDFANHRPTPPHTTPTYATPHRNQAGGRAGPTEAKSGVGLRSPDGIAVPEGDELYLQYGAHANRTLFVEYGFVNEIKENEALEGMYMGEADVDDLVGKLFATTQDKAGKWLREALEEEGYWGDWTIHSDPTAAHPSFRLIAALRLYHLLPPSQLTVPADGQGALRLWRDTLLGNRDRISEENEKAWRETLQNLCEHVVERAEAGMERVLMDGKRDGMEWEGYARRRIWTLWREEWEVGKAVLMSLEKGEEF